ncbi:hypothetical protein SprV_0301048600 [Sparganum proliferum]
MGEDGTTLLLQVVAERPREKKRHATQHKFPKLPDPTSSRVNILVSNLSSKELTKDQMQVLWHEATFNTADAKHVNMISTVESVINQTEMTEMKNLIRHQISPFLLTHMPREMLPKVEQDVLRDHKANKDIAIVPADKGRPTLILDRIEYLQKGKNLLEECQF